MNFHQELSNKLQEIETLENLANPFYNWQDEYEYEAEDVGQKELAFDLPQRKEGRRFHQEVERGLL